MVLFSPCDTHLIRPFFGLPHTVPSFCSLTINSRQACEKKDFDESGAQFLLIVTIIPSNDVKHRHFLFVVSVIVCYPSVVHENLLSPTTKAGIFVPGQPNRPIVNDEQGKKTTSRLLLH